MKTVNFKDIKVYNLDGTEIPTPNLHESVANAVYRQASASPVRNVELARKIYSEGTVELLAEDMLIVKNAVINTSLIGDCAKIEILKALE